MTDFTIDDMINNAIESKPETFKDAFNHLMAAKIAQAVEDKKLELAQNMFSGEQEEEQSETDSNEEYQEDEYLETEDTEV